LCGDTINGFNICKAEDTSAIEILFDNINLNCDVVGAGLNENFIYLSVV